MPALTQPTITQYYQADHDRLDGLFDEFQRLKQTDLAKAREFFEKFCSGLNRHIRWEEEILFPIFEEKSGMQGVGPTAVMRSEHVQIRNFLDAIRKKLAQGSADTGREEAFLFGHLGIHNQKEEMILYPAIDRLIGATDLERIYRQMEETAFVPVDINHVSA